LKKKTSRSIKNKTNSNKKNNCENW
jgi:hypothetical protein